MKKLLILLIFLMTVGYWEGISAEATQCSKEGNEGYLLEGRYIPRCKPEPVKEEGIMEWGSVDITSSDNLLFDSGFSPIAYHAITITNEKGQEANIDFSGDKVVYSGDLPIDESARLFFKYVFGVYQEAATLAEIKEELKEIKNTLRVILWQL